MRTTDKTTTVQIPFAAVRLAEQLGMSLEKVITSALKSGLRGMDWNLSENCDPMGDGFTDDFNVTRAMDNLSEDRLRRIQASNPELEPQQVLKLAAFTRGSRRRQIEKQAPSKLSLLPAPEGEEEHQEETVIKLRCKPTLVS